MHRPSFPEIGEFDWTCLAAVVAVSGLLVGLTGWSVYLCLTLSLPGWGLAELWRRLRPGR